MYKLFTKDISEKLRIVDTGADLEDILTLLNSQRQLRKEFADLGITTKRPILSLITSTDTKTA